MRLGEADRGDGEQQVRVDGCVRVVDALGVPAAVDVEKLCLRRGAREVAYGPDVGGRELPGRSEMDDPPLFRCRADQEIDVRTAILLEGPPRRVAQDPPVADREEVEEGSVGGRPWPDQRP